MRGGGPGDVSPTARRSRTGILSAALVCAGALGVVFWIPLSWSIYQNRHSLQLTGHSSLLAALVLFLAPVAAAAVLDAALARIAPPAHRAWRLTLAGATLGWFLFLNVHYDNPDPMPAIALVLSLLVGALLVLDLLKALRRRHPRLSVLTLTALCAVGTGLIMLVVLEAPFGYTAVPVVLALVLLAGIARALRGRLLATGNAVLELAGGCALAVTVALVAGTYWLDWSNARTRADALAGSAVPDDAPGPVFVFVFDGMSREAITGPDGEILGRFPTLRRLAAEGLWVRDATTNFDHTRRSIPSMLFGRLAESYDMHDTPSLFEHVSPPYTTELRGVVLDYCTPFARPAVHHCVDQRHYFATADARAVLSLLIKVWVRSLPRLVRPPVVGTAGLLEVKDASAWMLDELVDRARHGPVAGHLFFTHVLTPHTPFTLRPDGSRNDDVSTQRFAGTPTPEKLAEAVENYRLEIEYDDRFLARLIAALEARGVWQRTTLVITADHGYSWEWATRDWGTDLMRNLVTEQIARIPFFVKPRAGFTVSPGPYAYRSVDLIPTLLHLLDLPPAPGARLDGRSALRPRAPDDPLTVVSTSGHPWDFDPASGAWHPRPRAGQ